MICLNIVNLAEQVPIKMHLLVFSGCGVRMVCGHNVILQWDTALPFYLDCGVRMVCSHNVLLQCDTALPFYLDSGSGVRMGCGHNVLLQ